LYSAFLSHDWGQDEIHENHFKVKHISFLFKDHKVKSWIDDSNNRDNMLFSIAEGIRQSHFFILFLTANLNEKIKRGHERKEWCFRELNYAAYKLSPKNMIVVVLEEEMTKREKWADSLLLLFATDVYFDLSKAPKVGDSCWDYTKTKDWSRLVMKLREYDSLLSTVESSMQIKEPDSDVLSESDSKVLTESVADGEPKEKVTIPAAVKKGEYLLSTSGILLSLGVCIVLGFSFYRRSIFR
jgi:hypothetical protein